jgi:hypothetical protein
MYQFAIMALLALAVVKLVDFIDTSVPGLAGFRSISTFILGIGAVYALDYSIFDGFGVTVRNEDMGMILTGFMIAGLTVAWRAVFGYVTHDKAVSDESLGGSGRKMRAA